MEYLKLLQECETMKDYVCAWSYVNNNIYKTCPTHCSITEYSGHIILKVSNFKSRNLSVYCGYVLSSNPIKVYKEYLLYDEAGLIGSVGGTLGLFIGFSFSGVIFNAIDYLRDHIRGLHIMY